MSEADRKLWTVRDVLQWTTGHFERKEMDAPRLDAELLLAHALGCDRVRLYVDHLRPLDEDERARFRALVERRAAGEPTAYILGVREFYGRPFRVDARVLVPRPETEHLVDRALSHLPADTAGPVLDLCSGSGCIGVTLAAERPGLEVHGVDLSPQAAEVARHNAAALGVEARYHQLVGDLFAPLGALGPFVLIAANPPYVPDAELAQVQREVRDHEPRLALAGGPDGLDVCRRILDGAAARLTPGGWLLMEHAEDQAPALRRLAEVAGYRAVETLRDHAGLDRVLVARRPT